MYVYVTLCHDYADEFDVECCFVDTKENFDKTIDIIRKKFEDGKITEDKEYYFGTNEFLQFNDFEDFNNGITVESCSKEFYDEFRKLNHGSVGYCVIDRMID